MMARLLAEARGREKASLKEEKEETKKDEVKNEINMEGHDGKKEEDENEEKGLLVHGLKGRRPKLSEAKKDEILTEETIRFLTDSRTINKY